MAFRRREEPSIEAEREVLREQRAALEEMKAHLAERVEAVRERERELQEAIASAGGAPVRETAPPPLPPVAAGDALASERSALAEREAELEHEQRSVASRKAALTRREHALEQREAALEAAVAAAAVATVAGMADGDGPDERERQLAERERRLVDLEADLIRREQELQDGRIRLEAREHELAERIEQSMRTTTEIAEPVADGPPPDAERLAQIETRLAELREAEALFLRTRDELAARSEAVAARERLVALKERELDEREDAASPWGGVEISDVEARLRRLEQQQPHPGEQTLGFSGGLRRLQESSRKPRS